MMFRNATRGCAVLLLMDGLCAAEGVSPPRGWAEALWWVGAGLAVLLLALVHWRAVTARRRLSQSFDEFFAISRNTLVLLDAKGRVTRANHCFEPLTGWPVGAALGQPLGHIIRLRPEGHATGEGGAVDFLVARQQERYLLRTQDGTERHVTLSTMPTGRPDCPTGAIVLIGDITVERQRDAELAESELRFRNLFDHLPDPVFVHCPPEDDPSMRYVEVNDAACALLGYARDEMLRLGVTDLTSRETTRGRIMELDIGVRPVSFCGVLLAKDGRRIPMEFHSLRLRRRGQWVMLTIGRDTTARQESERALRESEERYRLLFESANDRIGIFDLKGELIEANRFFYDALGFTKEEYLTIHWRERYHPDDLPVVDKATVEAFRTGRTEYEFRIRHRDGTWRNMFNRVVVVHAPDGAPLYIVSVIRDVTEHRRIEEQLAQSRKMESIGQLAGGIAHDFNNQLNGILGFVELLNETPGIPAEAQHFVDVIGGCARRCANLTSHLLAFARKGKYRREQIDLHQAVVSIVAMLKHTVDPRIEVRKEFFASNPLIRGDASQIENAILNVALNARDAMPDGGVLSLMTDSVCLSEDECRSHGPELVPGEYVRLTVSDTGVGMGEEVQRRIFDPFFTTKPVGKGTGMGLAAVYGIVTHHGGFVTVASEPGQGSSFFLHFPATEAHPEAEAVPVVPDAELSVGCVLVVEDEEANRALLRQLLLRWSGEVLEAEDGRAALDCFRARHREIDLVLLDMMMPHLSGEETFLAMRAIDPHARVVLITGHAGADDAVKNMLAHGLAGVLHKPIARQDLADILHRVLPEPEERHEAPCG